MPRLTLGYMRLNTRLPQVLGLCTDDVPSIAAAVDAAQQRLVYAGEIGDEGWWGSWAYMGFNVLRDDPFIALNRYGARLMDAAICSRPIAINNQFAEFLQFGNGYLNTTTCRTRRPHWQSLGITDRGEYPAFRDLTEAEGGRTVRVRATNPLDAEGTVRTLIQGTDIYDEIIYSQNSSERVTGTYLTLADPFVDTAIPLKTLTGIQKDVTLGQVQYYDVDPSTGDESLILTMEPGETVAGYRRYYLSGLPSACNPVIRDSSNRPVVQVQGLVKLNLLPVSVDSDYLLIQNAEAIIAECQSARYSTMDLPNAKQMAFAAHKDAIRLLQGELNHFLGHTNIAVGFAPFGSATLAKQAIGTLI